MPIASLPASLNIPASQSAVSSALVTNANAVISAAATAIATPNNTNITALETAITSFVDHWKVAQVALASSQLDSNPTDAAKFFDFVEACRKYTQTG